MPDNRLRANLIQVSEYTEITYDKNVVNFSGNDKTVPAVYRSCVHKVISSFFLFISLFAVRHALSRVALGARALYAAGIDPNLYFVHHKWRKRSDRFYRSSSQRQTIMAQK